MISFLCFVSNVLFCQVQIVNDPTNLAKIKEMVKSSEETVGAMKKQLQYIEDAKKQLETVNSYVRQAQSTKKALERAQSLTNTITKAQSDLSSLGLDNNQIDTYSKTLNEIYANALGIISELTSILTDGSLKMSDAERLRMIKEADEALWWKETQIKRQVELAQKAKSRQATLNILSNGGR